jgi:predicted RNA-binding protein associated with RNAse of E/G family
MPAAGVTRPTVVNGRAVLEPGAPVVWFTFPGRHHDIGRFHTADGAFTGCYANILTPVELDADPPAEGTPNDAALARASGADGAGGEPAADPTDSGDVWLTTDLFLDVFVDLEGGVHVLDRDELKEAVAMDWVDAATARAAELEANRLVEAARAGKWPPPVVDDWPLERARDVAGRR